MFRKLLIANRGEIAVRIMRTAKRLGVLTVAVYSDADANALHVEMADEAWRIGPSPAMQSYLDQNAIIAAAVKSGAQAIHPGYGFLAENAEFAEAVAAAGLRFVGPPPQAIRVMGLKDQAKRLIEKAGVPVLPGYDGAAQDAATLSREASRIGYPILVKPVAGGGGKGMRRVDSPDELDAELAASRREALSAFGNGDVLLEKFISQARHIEVQIMADAHGNVVHLFERDCSLQRRHQKVVEETPAPGLPENVRELMCGAAIAAARAVGYVSAGTVEFLADISDSLRPDRFYFMEMNTRLQVEHPVTELVTGLDLVELQLRVAAGEPLPLRQDDIVCNAHAIEARLYAEDPDRAFQPQTGRLSRIAFPDEPSLRVDAGVRSGDSVLPYYDPMIAKLSVQAASRELALSHLARALAGTEIAGSRTNLDFLIRLLCHPQVGAGDVDTGLIERELASLLAAPEPPLVAAAAAMLLACGYLAQPASTSPFDILRRFRLWGGESCTQHFAAGSRKLICTLTAEGDRFVATCDSGTLRFRLLGFEPPVLRLDCGDHIATLRIWPGGDRTTVTLDAGRYEFVTAASASGRAAAEDSGLVSSPIPGLVRKVLVKTGDRVERGAPLIIVEAMKMEMTLLAERSGSITQMNAAEGDQIVEGAVLVRIGDA